MTEQEYYLEILKKMKKDYTKRIKDCIGVLSYNSIVEYENICSALSFAIKAINANDTLKAQIREYQENWRPKIRDNY